MICNDAHIYMILKISTFCDNFHTLDTSKRDVIQKINDTNLERN